LRILILGGDGMLGHQFFRSWRNKHEVRVTLHRDLTQYETFGLYDSTNSYCGLDVRDLKCFEDVVEKFSPEVVVNAVGVTKQLSGAENITATIEVNALIPHKLAEVCGRHDVRLIHMSTDCVFSGHDGNYSEHSVSDVEDLYGRSKYLGEVDSPNVLTLRKSTIGLELSGAHGLLEWFLTQRGKIKGFRKAIYSGVISSELARVIEMLLLEYPKLSGVWNVASEPINKYDLLVQLADRLGRNDIIIEPFDGFVCDRSLNAAAFCEQTGYIAPSWTEMLDELVVQIKERKQ